MAELGLSYLGRGGRRGGRKSLLKLCGWEELVHEFLPDSDARCHHWWVASFPEILSVTPGHVALTVATEKLAAKLFFF
jgi:hypothetical protein